MPSISVEEAFNDLHKVMREITLETPTIDGLESATKRLYQVRDSILANIDDVSARRKVTWAVSRAAFMEAVRREASLEVCKNYLDSFAASGFGSDYFKYYYHEIYAVQCEALGKNDEALALLNKLKIEIDLKLRGPKTEEEHDWLCICRERIDEKIAMLEK